MHKRVSLSMDEKIIAKVKRYMKGKNRNFSQTIEDLITKVLK